MGIGSRPSNGWMLSVISFACQEYGWSFDYVVGDISLLALMLLMRQKIHGSTNGKGDGFTLLESRWTRRRTFRGRSLSGAIVSNWLNFVIMGNETTIHQRL